MFCRSQRPLARLLKASQLNRSVLRGMHASASLSLVLPKMQPSHKSSIPVLVRQSRSMSMATEEKAAKKKEEEEEVETEAMSKKRKAVSSWLLIVSGMVLSIVIVGGLTRLEEGGLSMVEWKPLGLMPPMGEEEWEAEFERYKQFPEYKKKHMNITLSEFKYIFFWEYFHRILGRLIGVSFVLPAAYFWGRGHFSMPLLKKVHMGKRSLLITAMIGLQGALGWYMVKSGLDENHELMVKYNAIPRVSQYRLASHLGAAFVIYAATLWTYFDVKNAKSVKVSKNTLQAVPAFRGFAAVIAGVVFLTVISGAFVAGMDAGLVYNEFPMMGGRWIPEDIFALSPKMVNFFENATTVQFDHRVMATVTSLLVFGIATMARRPQIAARLNRTTMNAVYCLVGALLVQYGLGISTLLYHVPTPLASAHQTGSLLLFTMAMWLLHCTRRRFVMPSTMKAAATGRIKGTPSLKNAAPRTTNTIDASNEKTY